MQTMPPCTNESIAAFQHTEFLLKIPHINEIYHGNNQSKNIPETESDITTVGAKGRKMPQHHICLSKVLAPLGIEEDLSAQNTKLGNVQVHTQNLKSHLQEVSKKVNALSKECNAMKDLSAQLKEEIRVLLIKRNRQRWRMEMQKKKGEDKKDNIQSEIQKLIKNQLDLKEERTTLRMEEINHILSCGTTAAKLIAFSASVMYLI